MNKITSIVGALLLGGASIAQATQCPTTNVISEPELFQWTHHPATTGNPEEYYSGVLEMGEASFVINGETLTTRAYRQGGGNYSIPGPTVVMEPGKKYVVTFRNLLPYEAPSPDHNVFKDPNISNLHTHGLHISPENPSDEVTRVIEGGYAGDYVYDISADHMGGTYWYHAHHHGSTYLQAAGGAFGLMIIDDKFDGIPANVASMVERKVVVAYLDPNARGTGGDTLISGTLAPSWTVNGAINGNLCSPPDSWQHWRVLLADRDGRAKTLSVGNQCELALMSRDGVWRTQVPKILATNSISLSGASRADIAVRCSADSQISVNGNPVASIFVDAALPADSTSHPFAADGVSTWASKRPSYLRDLRAQTPDNFETVNMGARTINGAKFDMNSPTFVLNADGMQEWSIKGGLNHPFHLHVYHFQVVGNCGGDFEDGEYYDTLAGNCAIRFDLNAQTSSVFEGKTIMHCHILDHEDQGGMGFAQVIGGLAPPTFPQNGDIGSNYQVRYPINGGGNGGGTAPNAPSGLSAGAVSSSQIDLTWADNSADETGFSVERSTDGVNFGPGIPVAANSTSYSDTGLNASTTYWYRVNAANGNGTSAYSNVASATTAAGSGTATDVQVGSISLRSVNVGGGRRVGEATIQLLDNQGNPVAGAVVSGEFTGDITESADGTSDTSGTAIVTTTGTGQGGLTLQFCVTGINAGSLQYNPVPGQDCGSM
ncbi:MAG: multicopper oxidase domain-containing protein [Gammaproteobacteria bacterium]|nr:multicopper oxidase domain-containing protein [Gammaproteobacteria bacterium]